ncbi:hypothetical protein OPW33_23115 [Vibrio europaeus]|uniref:hypothetical protein n=1 Tax=Vibrio europaeus TaxID=300876 RepID=UPI0023411AAD|nr:hypothetical protein [Vibrio europaeus]MDC5842220.1 hypothetical protein [Vibrio europaeus]
MVDLTLIILAIGFACFARRGMRADTARTRLQACIDNGKAQFDGHSIRPSMGITDSEKAKIDKEIQIYLHVRRESNGFPGPLYRKDSAN